MRLLHFADLHLGVESYGHIDPETGLSSRLQDFLAVFDQMVDYALSNQVHLVVFAGDAYKSREPSPTQQREFAKRIARLTSAGIPVFLLVGNHDQPQALGKANAVDIFNTLAIPNTTVADKPGVYRVETVAGSVQVLALPWLKRSAFLAREEAKDLPFDEIDRQLRDRMTAILQAKIAELDPNVPAVLAAHVWVDVAKPSGTERMLSLGGEPQLLLSTLTQRRPIASDAILSLSKDGAGRDSDPVFSYAALGHIHRHQVLSQRPVVAYSGSLERLDFREEADDKGFMVVDIERRGMGSGGWEVRHEFHPVDARRFLTVEVKLSAQDLDPTASVLQAIERRRDKVPGAIVRVNIEMPQELEGQIRENDVRRALEGASYVAAISRDVKREARLRLGGAAVEKMSPLRALEEYLKQKKVEAQRIELLKEYAQKLMQEEE
ncbi:MAG: exonuclease SbcCD subunit D [Chloroflexi bacterium]|nr:exonuclease SbcCD subunit D [Chloroflexota bacterium]